MILINIHLYCKIYKCTQIILTTLRNKENLDRKNNITKLEGTEYKIAEVLKENSG